MTKYLITHSLLSSLSWYLKESFTKSDEQQRQEFLQTLRRVKSEPNEAMQKGLDFEGDVQQYCVDKFEPTNRVIIHLDNDEEEEINEWDDYSKSVIALGKIVKGGIWQQATKKELSVNGYDIVLYGRCDVIKADTVYDIKYTSNYELGKYQDSGQHWIYLYCTGLSKFSYLISDGKEWWREDYYSDENLENKVKANIGEFLSYLENDQEAKELFLTNWESKY